MSISYLFSVLHKGLNHNMFQHFDVILIMCCYHLFYLGDCMIAFACVFKKYAN